MSTPAELAPVLEAGGVELSRHMHRTESRLAEVAEGHGADLSAHAAGTLSAGGKRLRPLLVFLCAADGEPALPAAVAVELLHMATLVHDDVLDRAELRRGRPTVFSSGGREAATATGRPAVLARVRRAGGHRQRGGGEGAVGGLRRRWCAAS